MPKIYPRSSLESLIVRVVAMILCNGDFDEINIKALKAFITEKINEVNC